MSGTRAVGRGWSRLGGGVPLAAVAGLAGACVSPSKPPAAPPAPAAAAQALPAAPANALSLRQAIDSMVDAPQFRNAHWGVLIVDPERGDTLYSRNAGKLFLPASNQKLVTAATALELLGADYRYRTLFAARAVPRDGVVEGDLVVVGRGDPTVSDHMRGDAMLPLREVADSLAARGVRRIRGRVVRGGDAFPDAPLGFGWAWDDLPAPYSAGVDELTFNEGFTRVLLRGATAPGTPPAATTAPLAGYPALDVTAVTAPPGRGGPSAPSPDATWGPPRTPRGVLTPTRVSVTGVVAPGDTTTVTASYPDPAAAYLLAVVEALAARGIEVARGADPEARVPAESIPALVTLASLESPPLREILPALQKPSQNQIAEALFKTLGLERTGVGSADSGRRVVETQLAAWGAAPDGFAVRDGSGLSRHDYLTPETIVRVLAAMQRHPSFAAYYEALPVAGVDGTIASRMRGTPAQGNVRAKTGYVDRARSLSGYVTTADGRLLLFSFLCNNWTTPVRAVERVQDEIAIRLAASRLADLR